MKPSSLTYLIYVLIEIVWLIPFLTASAVLAFAQSENGVERQLESRLKAANLFLLTAVAARVIAATLRHNIGDRWLPATDIVSVIIALLLAFLLQLAGRLVSEYGLDIGAGLLRILAVVTVVILSTGLVAVASPLLDQLKLLQGFGRSNAPATKELPINYKVKADEEWLFKREPLAGQAIVNPSATVGRTWIFSLLDEEDARPLTFKELARAKTVFERMGPVYVPKKPYKPKKETVPSEKIPAILEYPDVVPSDLLPKSDAGMVLADIARVNKNMISARIVPHLVTNNGRLTGKIMITALYNTKAAEQFFGRRPGSSKFYIGGQRVVLSAGQGNIIARWTKRRFAFEVQVDWAGPVDNKTPIEFLQHIVGATAAAIDIKID